MIQIIGAILAGVLGAIVLSNLLPEYINTTVAPIENSAGAPLSDMASAAPGYMQTHFAGLITSTAGGPYAVTPAMLIAAGNLYAGFNDFNVFQQQHVLLVAQPVANTLEAFVCTYGGNTIADSTLISVAEAGPETAGVILSTDAANIEGASTGYIRPTNVFATASYPLTVGHLCAHILPVTYESAAPYSNRYATGNPEDNTYHTDVLMNGNNIQNAKQITATAQVNTPTVADPTTPSMQVTPAGASNMQSLTLQNETATGSITAKSYYYLP